MTRPHYLIEFHHIGAYVKVSVIDPVTNTEASIVATVVPAKQR
jgi:hypothetical protein